MRETLLKVVLPIVLATITALQAHSCRVEYIKGKDQESMGRLVMSLNKECAKEMASESPNPIP
jgi:hypothetical protein